MRTKTELIKIAKLAGKQAIAPYSGFKVGAALLSKKGKIFTGCNIEVSSYSLTICAERVALFKALSEGVREFDCLAIYANTENFCPPCGACRQVIWDFARDLTIVLINKKKEQREVKIADLYPDAFDEQYLSGLEHP
ncbi:MAG TPA: cytidine deaminase [Bacteroidetes bacterium]|nr:cytidine deaminase [Bacteroidota bacterium]